MRLVDIMRNLESLVSCSNVENKENSEPIDIEHEVSRKNFRDEPSYLFYYLPAFLRETSSKVGLAEAQLMGNPYTFQHNLLGLYTSCCWLRLLFQSKTVCVK